MDQTTDKKKRTPKQSSIEPRKKTGNYMTLTMLVDRDWSGEVSKRARDLNLSKTQYLVSLVNNDIEQVKTAVSNEEMVKMLKELNSKVDTLTALVTTMALKNSKK